MRAKLLHPATLLALVALLVALDVPSQAARQLGLTRNSVTTKTIRDGTIRIRDLSRRVRRQLARAGTTGPQGLPGTTGPPGPAPSCPVGTVLNELTCIETAQRAQDPFEAARTTCRDAGRRLASVEELVTFEQRTEAFVPTGGSEWAGLFTDFPLPSTEPSVGYAVRFTDGQVFTDDAESVYNYRCVAQGAL
jgi:hypothetical protein